MRMPANGVIAMMLLMISGILMMVIIQQVLIEVFLDKTFV